MDNIKLFPTIVTNAITQKYFHYLLMIIEYIIFIFPYGLLYPKRILNLFSTSSLESSNNLISIGFIEIFNQFKVSLLSPLPLTCTILTCIFLIIYYLIILFYEPTLQTRNMKNSLLEITRIVLVNIYDIIFFRYCAFIFIDCIVYMILYSISISSFVYNIIALLFSLFLFFYMITIVNYINRNIMVFDINNDYLTKCYPKYPFTLSMKETDLYLLALKLLIAIGNNSFHLYEFKWNSMAALTIAICVVIFILAPIKIIYSQYTYDFLKIRCWVLLDYNILRYYLIIFHWLISVSVLLFGNEFSSTTIELLFYIFGGLFGALLILLFLKKKMTDIILNGDITLVKFIYLATQELTINTPHSEMISKIYSRMLTKHFMNCNQKCQFCQYHSINFTKKNTTNIHNAIKPFYSHSQPLNNYLVNLFKVLRKGLLKVDNQKDCSKDLRDSTCEHNLYLETLELFYYRMKKKIFKFFFCYTTFRHRYRQKHSLLIDNISLLITCFFSELASLKSDQVFFSEIFLFSSINKSVQDVIVPLKDYVLSRNTIKYPEKLIPLAADLDTIKNVVFKMIQKAEKKEDSHQDFAMRTIRNILNYSLIIVRFVLEALFNETFRDIPPLDIDMLEEFLTFHFEHDKTLIISVNFPENSKQMITLKVLKFTGMISKKEYTSFSEYFPYYIRQEGYDIFVNTLFSYKLLDKAEYLKINNNHLDSEKIPMGSFKFLVQKKHNVEYINYEYYLSPQFIGCNHSLLLYGFYSDESQSVLFTDNIHNNRTLITFSKDIQNILCIKAKWLTILSKYKMTITLEEIFNIKIINTTIESSQPELKREDEILFSCELVYSHYNKMMMKHLNFLMNLEELKTKEKTQKALLKSKGFLLNKTDHVQSFRMKTLMSITSTKIVYSLFNFEENYKTEGTKVGVNNTKQHQYSLIPFQTVNLSSSSVHERSLNRTSLEYSIHDEKRRIKDKRNSSAEKKKMQLYSIITIFLNSCLIFTCVIFLIVEVTVTQQIQAFTNLFFQYKTLKLSFSSLFLTFGASICYVEKPDDITCTNQLIEYSKMYHDEVELPDNLLFEEYLRFELEKKAVYMQDLLVKIKVLLYDIKDPELLGLYSMPLNYSSLNHTEKNKINQLETEITFEDGIRIYLNNFAIIAKEDYINVPFYYISMSNNKYNFDNILKVKKQLTNLEMEIYKAMMNFYNFEIVFRIGQTIILDKFEASRTQNVNYLIIFMVIAVILDIVLLFLSRINIFIGYNLFKEIINKIHFQIDNIDSKAYIESKLQGLILISHLYSTNPNPIIQSLKTKQAKYKEQLLKKQKQTTNQLHESKDGTNDLLIANQKKAQYKNKIDIKSNAGYEKIYNETISKFLNINTYLFLIYFIFIGIFDIVLIFDFNNVFDTFRYILFNSHLENWLYNDIIFTHLLVQINTTESSLNNLMNIKANDNDLINTFLITTFDYHKEILRYQNISNTAYPPLSSYFEYDCNKIMAKINDSHLYLADNILKKQYSIIPTKICEHFELLHLPNFEFLYRELLMRIQNLFNQQKNKITYKELATFSRNRDTFDIYVIELFFLRPLRKFYTVSILTPLINNSFANYMAFVVIYLVVNCALECLVFMVIKWFIVGKLTKIQEDLFLLEKCFD